mmetsp:Transcript_3937/g.11467  ORF Transcript_3937/g.11467 Transcript_3937/m.11467 type:complete len:231 (+) Transcript_3937:463-1155(+)
MDDVTGATCSGSAKLFSSRGSSPVSTMAVPASSTSAPGGSPPTVTFTVRCACAMFTTLSVTEVQSAEEHVADAASWDAGASSRSFAAATIAPWCSLNRRCTWYDTMPNTRVLSKTMRLVGHTRKPRWSFTNSGAYAAMATTSELRSSPVMKAASAMAPTRFPRPPPEVTANSDTKIFGAWWRGDVSKAVRMSNILVGSEYMCQSYRSCGAWGPRSQLEMRRRSGYRRRSA